MDTESGYAVIRKSPPATGAEPNLVDYEATRARFSWADARAALDGLPEGRGLNIAHEAVDRHAAGPRADHVAIRWLGRDGARRDISYRSLRDLTNRFANVLGGLGIRRGERVFALAPRIPDLYVAALGSLKAGAVFSPLFAAFGPEPIRTRVDKGEGRVVITTPALYRRKDLASLRADLPFLDHVILAGGGEGEAPAGTYRLDALMDAASDDFVIPATHPEDMALLHFTSGTTGTPKGAVHVHEAVVCHHATGALALDLHPEDVFWCTADPGWVTGTSYGIIAPLTHGVTSVVDEAEFDVERWYRVLEEERVTVWYTAPTAVRMLMKAGEEPASRRDLSSLRFVGSVGEPLNPAAVVWGHEVLGRPIHDNWWQTETGGIMIANFASMDIKPGSMGRPVPGIDAAIVARDDDGHVMGILGPGEEGELALRPGWPSMFRGYLHQRERYERSFDSGWYLTGDLARVDEDGWYWFVGRADDVIKSAGHLIGPFEVESVLMEHEAVAEAAVVGIPDEVIGESVKAFVVLHPGHTAGEDLERALRGHARKRLGAAVAPREIAFEDHLPHTRSGKTMRRLLKAREMGLPEGDTSTLETPS
ncbi:MAG: acetate--CoA ligase [Myxococcota bacterium]